MAGAAQGKAVAGPGQALALWIVAGAEQEEVVAGQGKALAVWRVAGAAQWEAIAGQRKAWRYGWRQAQRNGRR